MEDVFNRVLTKVNKYLNNNGYPNLKMTSIYSNTKASLPHVELSLIVDNAINNTFDLEETHCSLSFQFDIYSNSSTDKVKEINDIATKINYVMNEIHFRRTANQFINNTNPAISRKVVRYRRNTLTENEIQRIV